MNATDIVNELLDESLVNVTLLEARADELAAKFNVDIAKVKELALIDPTRNQKYLPWLVARWAAQDQGFSDQELLRTSLQQFERLLKLPAFQGSKDIQQYGNIEQLITTVKESEGLTSKKEKMLAGAKVVAKDGPLTLIKIEGDNNYQTLIYYSTHNVLNPPAAASQQGGEEGQTNWCVRFPEYSQSHLRQGPFYIVLKNGMTYLAIHPASGQVKNTDQHRHQFTGGQANEIARLVNQEILGGGENMIRNFHGDMRHFINVIDLPPGSTIDDNLDYSGTKGRKLPENLTVNGSLNLEGSDIAVLPPGLKVKGDLNIKNTPIKSLGNATAGGRLLRDEDFPKSEIFMFVFRVKMPQMKTNFILTRTTKGYKDKGQTMPPITQQEAEAQWPKMADELARYYASLADADKEPDPSKKEKRMAFAQRVLNEIS